MRSTDLPLENADYFIKVIPFGVPIPAIVRLNSDGTYTLFLNADYDYEHWLNSYVHELFHIIRDDLYGDKDIRDIEFKRGA